MALLSIPWYIRKKKKTVRWTPDDYNYDKSHLFSALLYVLLASWDIW